ncbi:hypothetical protein AeNC1_003315 [Aphanomyces euteiches]|nr:hypothetical protein AeNC1_003315 [Aphanomyces euteiches]
MSTPKEWRSYGVLLLSGNSKTEKATRDKLLTVLSGALTPREKGVFKVIKRVDLAPDKTDPDSLAAAFYKIVDRERIEHMQSKAVQPTDTSPTSSASATITPIPSEPPHPPRKQMSRQGSMLKEGLAASTHEAQHNEAQVEIEADEDVISAAQAALEADARATAPTHIYVFVDYPATVAEVKSLITFRATSQPDHPPTLTALIDGVVSMVMPTLRKSSVVQAPEVVQDTATVIAPTPTPTSEPKAQPKGKGKQPAPPVQPQPVAPPLETTAPPPQDAAANEAGGVNKLYKELQVATKVGGLEWTDFTFDVVDCSSTTGDVRPLTALTMEFKQILSNLAADKAMFKEWLEGVQVIGIPTHDPKDHPMDVLERTYAETLDALYEPSLSVAAIVYAMAEAVVKSFTKPAPSKKKAPPPIPNPPPPKKTFTCERFIDYGDLASMRLAKSLRSFLSKHPCMRLGEPTEILGRDLGELKRSMWLLNDLPGVGHDGRRGMPLVPKKSFVERSIDNTKLMHFLTLDMEDVHFTLKMLEFESMLGPLWKNRLRSRSFIEHLPPHILPQRISTLIGLHVALKKRYYEPDDSTLLAGYIETPRGRKLALSWNATEFVRHRPPFKDWRQENLLPQEYLTPRTISALGAVIGLSMAELAAVSETTHTLFPSDHAVIHVNRSQFSRTWLSVYKDSHVFGLRPSEATISPNAPSQPPTGTTKVEQPSKDFHYIFHASFSDDSQLRICRGSGKTIIVTHTSVSGLLLIVSSDGTIQQSYAATHAAARSQYEARRLIVGKGTVVATCKSGSQSILYANGSTASRTSSAEPFVTVNEQGMPSCNDASWPLPSKIPVHIEVDPESRAVIAHREDGVVVVTHPNGAFLTQHTDGTRIYGNPTCSHVVVVKEGFAEVSIDVDVNLTAQRHAKGMKVAVTKGGIRTRSVLRLDDGTTMEVDYDTRVIASVHGIIRIRKPDGTVVVAQDNGVVEFRPQTLNHGPVTPRREDEEELDTSTGAYYFNCFMGSLSMSDHEHNSYHVTLGDGTMEPIVDVELAGIVTSHDCEKYDVPPMPVAAVVNDPLEPFLLILNGDGTATEVLRPIDVAEYHRQIERNKHIHSVTNYEKNATSARTHVFLHDLDPVEPNEAWFADHKERKKLLDQVSVIPARASPFILGELHNIEPPQPPLVHIVRRLKELVPFNPSQFKSMMDALDAWRDWRSKREAAVDQYAVCDPRDADTIAAALASHKKVKAALKTARAKAKAERQKHKDKDKPNMATLEEVENEGDEGNGKFLSLRLSCLADDLDAELDVSEDDSENDSRDELDLNVDDDYELTLTAFSQADIENSGRLNAAQTRRALVHALGFGVTQAEVNTAIPIYTEAEDHRVTFEAFSRMLHAFRDAASEDSQNIDRIATDARSMP